MDYIPGCGKLDPTFVKKYLVDVPKEEAREKVLSSSDLMNQVLKGFSAEELFHMQFVCRTWRELVLGDDFRKIYMQVGNTERFGVLIRTVDPLYYKLTPQTLFPFKIKNRFSTIGKKKQTSFLKTMVLASDRGILLMVNQDSMSHFVCNPVLGVFSPFIVNASSKINNTSCLVCDDKHEMFHIISLIKNGNGLVVTWYESKSQTWKNVSCQSKNFHLLDVKGLALSDRYIVWIRPGRGQGVYFDMSSKTCQGVRHIQSSLVGKVVGNGNRLMCIDIPTRSRKMIATELAEPDGHWKVTCQIEIPSYTRIRVLGLGLGCEDSIYYMADGILVEYSFQKAEFRTCLNILDTLGEKGSYFSHMSNGQDEVIPFVGTLALAGMQSSLGMSARKQEDSLGIALTAIEQTSLGFLGAHGVVIATTKKLPSKLVGQVQKIQKLKTNIGVIYSGVGSDVQTEVKATKEKDVKKLVKETASIMQRKSTSEADEDSSVLIASYDDMGPKLYQVDSSGSYSSLKHSAIGINSTKTKSFLNMMYREDLELAEAVRIVNLTLQDGFKEKLSSKDINVGVIGNDKVFKILTPSEIDDLLSK